MQRQPISLTLVCHRFDRKLWHEPTRKHVQCLDQVRCDWTTL